MAELVIWGMVDLTAQLVLIANLENPFDDSFPRWHTDLESGCCESGAENLRIHPRSLLQRVQFSTPSAASPLSITGHNTAFHLLRYAAGHDVTTVTIQQISFPNFEDDSTRDSVEPKLSSQLRFQLRNQRLCH